MSDLRRNVGIDLAGCGLIITGFDRIDRDLFGALDWIESPYGILVHTYHTHSFQPYQICLKL